MRDGQEPEDENDAQESGDGAATNPDGEASTVNGGANGAGDGVRRSDESAHAGCVLRGGCCVWCVLLFGVWDVLWVRGCGWYPMRKWAEGRREEGSGW